jgi:hypothetical protein
MKPKTRNLLIALAIVLLALGAGYRHITTGCVDAMGELRKTHLAMAEYLLAHDHRWPQPGDENAGTWWRSRGTDRMPGTFEVGQIDATPNMAFYDSRKAWLTYTTPDGIRHELLPDGRIVVTER